MTDTAIGELVPCVGVRDACQAVGAAQASYYRRHRTSAPPARLVPIPHRDRHQPRALSQAERHAILDVLHSDRFVDMAPAEVWATLLDDVGVPLSRIVDLLAAVEGIASRRGVLIGTFGHAGDGNMHPTVVFDRNDSVALERARAAFDDIVRAALELGGTITGEHGVGALKRPFLGAQLGAGGLHLHHAIKNALDPLGILNPGKVF